MPSTSPKQHRFMEMVAHDPAAAKRVGVPQKVGKDFASADGDTSFAHGGSVEHKQLAKQATAHAEHAKGTGQSFELGGIVQPPTMGISSSYPPPPGHRSEGPRNYGKK